MKNFYRAVLISIAASFLAPASLRAAGKTINIDMPALNLNDVENVSLDERLSRGEKGDLFSLYMAGLRLYLQEKKSGRGIENFWGASRKKLRARNQHVHRPFRRDKI
ncbi:MAG: hypothetical protein J6T16_05330 [Opitutales bacterium]|nr:hypothetical protein [Opitutales bacterium]